MTGGKLVYSTANQRVVSRDPVTITIQPEAQDEQAERKP